MLFTPILESAFRLSARAHREQTRKSSDLPYVVHPCSVMLILQRAGIEDDAVLAAALLHDVVEDTEVSLEDLKGEFPEEVVAWVAATSEQKETEAGGSRPWKVRKQEHLEHVAGEDWQARAIVLADKIHNLYSMQFDLNAGEAVWERFNAPPEHVLWYNLSMIEAAAGDDSQLVPLKAFGLQLVEELVEATGVEPASFMM